MVVCRLSEEKYLFVGKSIDSIFQIICNFVGCDIITEVSFSIVIADNLEFFDFHSSPFQDVGHGVLNERSEGFLVEML